MLWETQLYSGRHNYIVGDTIMLWETQLCSGASQFNWHIVQECKNLGIPKLVFFLHKRCFLVHSDGFWESNSSICYPLNKNKYW